MENKFLYTKSEQNEATDTIHSGEGTVCPNKTDNELA